MNYTDFIKINCIDTDHSCTLLVDSQADISLIKISSLKPNIILNQNEIINITGITSNAVSTLGTICTSLIVSNYLIQQIFHVVNDDFNIPANGILGKDFLKDNKCQINYENMILTISVQNERMEIPILNGTKNFSCIIPPRCEVYRIFHLNHVNEPMFVESQEISEGVFIAKGVINSKNPVLKIMNTTNKSHCIRNDKIKMEKLRNFQIYSINPCPFKDGRRTKELNSILEDRMPEDIRDDLMPICESYSDIFALKDDRMTTNNFYERKFRMVDSSPVYIKNYRLAHTQKEEINRQVQNLLDNNLIEPSSSNYNSPLILVPKKKH